jgi:hypothetical protein
MNSIPTVNWAFAFLSNENFTKHLLNARYQDSGWRSMTNVLDGNPCQGCKSFMTSARFAQEAKRFSRNSALFAGPDLEFLLDSGLNVFNVNDDLTSMFKRFGWFMDSECLSDMHVRCTGRAIRPEVLDLLTLRHDEYSLSSQVIWESMTDQPFEGQLMDFCVSCERVTLRT